MSYSIYIGELTFPGNDDVEGDLKYMEPGDQFHARTPEAANAKHPDAPTFINDEMTGDSNGRHPAYSGWDSFVREAGIYDMWYGPKGFLHEHPGCALLGQEHLDQVREALAARREKYPDAKPGFGGFMPGEERPDLDAVLARLLWLEFWMDWALKNCNVPVVSNY